jgi:hypothetical protein
MEHGKKMKLEKTSLLDAAVMCGGILMNKSRLLGAVCAGLLSIAASPALAAVVYGYSGDQFDAFNSTTTYDTSNFISGTVTLENLLAANTTSTPVILDFSFTDGHQTLSMANGAAIVAMEFTTDEDSITNWRVELNILPSGPLGVGDVTQTIITYNRDADVEDTGRTQTVTGTLPAFLFISDLSSVPISSIDFGTASTAGLWTGEIANVPLPAAAWLFGSGLLGLAGIARRKKTAPAEI